MYPTPHSWCSQAIGLTRTATVVVISQLLFHPILNVLNIVKAQFAPELWREANDSFTSNVFEEAFDDEAVERILKDKLPDSLVACCGRRSQQ